MGIESGWPALYLLAKSAYIKLWRLRLEKIRYLKKDFMINLEMNRVRPFSVT
jgi:hypothetical protein